MKKILMLIISLTFLFSCDLPDSGRKGTLQINLSLPDFYRQMLTEEQETVSDRIIPGEAKWIGIVLYQPFDGDATEEGFIPSKLDLEPILAKPETRVMTISFDEEELYNDVFSDLEPGTWNIMAFSFKNGPADMTTAEPDSEDIDVGALTFRIKRGITIETGYNSIDLPLFMNEMLYSGFSAIDVQADPFYPDNSNSMNPSDSAMLSLTNFEAGECRIPFSLSDYEMYPVTVNFYDSQGRLLDLEKTIIGETGYWTYQAQGPSDWLVIVMRSTVYFEGFFQINYGEVSYTYTSGSPPHILSKLSPQYGGV